MVQLCCAGCGVSFEKYTSEIKQQRRFNPTRDL